MTEMIRETSTIAAAICFSLLPIGRPTSLADEALLRAVSLYASFDEAARADFGGGSLELRTRMNHPDKEGEYIFKDGINSNVFRVAKDKGVSGGALECLDVLPRRGRIFFPAAKNLAYDRGGWDGAVSFWLDTDPNKLLKTPFCDPVQITQKGAHDGGIWVDFPDSKPRDMRMGVFRGLAAGEKPLKESDPKAPIVRLPRVPFQSGKWHHVALSWRNFDTGEANARAQLHVDGRLIGELTSREIAMNWDIGKTGIYVVVNYIGLFDELAVFDRALTEDEVQQLHRYPAWINERKDKLKQ